MAKSRGAVAAEITKPSVFLVRASYRRRRLADAARLLPLFGLCIFFVPLLWPSGTGVRMSVAISYVFGAWAALIAVVALFGWLARRVDNATGSDLGYDKDHLP